MHACMRVCACVYVSLSLYLSLSVSLHVIILTVTLLRIVTDAQKNVSFLLKNFLRAPVIHLLNQQWNNSAI